MTLLEAVQDIFEGLGEPSDLRYAEHGIPSVLVVAPDAKQIRAWTRLVGIVNRAQREIWSWKFPDGRQLRFKSAMSKTLFKTEIGSETIAGTLGAYTLTGTISGLYPQNESWVADVDGQLVQVLGSTAGTILIDRPLDAAFSGVITLHRRKYFWSGIAIGSTVLGEIPYGASGGVPMAIHGIESGEGATVEISRDIPITLSVSDPTEAFCTASGIEFVQAPETVQTYVVSYSAGPAGFDSATYGAGAASELILPSQYHSAVVLWGLWWGYRRAQENASAYSTKRDLDDFLRRTRSESDYDDEKREVQFTYVME